MAVFLLFGFVLFAGSVCGLIAMFSCQKLKQRIFALEKALGAKKSIPFLGVGATLPPVPKAKISVSPVEAVVPSVPAVESGACSLEVVTSEVLPELVVAGADEGAVVSSEPVPEFEPQVEAVSPVVASVVVGKGCSSAESFIGGKLFAWLGALCLFICLGYFAKYSIDYNLLTPSARVCSIYVFGATLIGFGVYFGRRTRFFILSEVFLSVGLLAFYIATIAAYRFYQLPGYSFEVAGVALVVITGLGLRLAYVVPSRTIACLSMIGGFATPFMLDLVSPEAFGFVWYLLLYLGVLNLGILLLSGLKRWSFMVPLGIVGSLIVFFSWLLMGDIEGYMTMSLVWLSGLVVLYAGFSLCRRVWEHLDGFCVLLPLWLLSVVLWVVFFLSKSSVFSVLGDVLLLSNTDLIVCVVLAVLSLALAVCVGLRSSFGFILYVAAVIFVNIVGCASFLGMHSGHLYGGWSDVPYCFSDGKPMYLQYIQSTDMYWGYIVSAVMFIVSVFFAAGLWLSLRREQEVAAKKMMPWYLYVSVLGGLMLLSWLGLGLENSWLYEGESRLVELLSSLILVGLSLWACMRWRFPWMGACLALGVACISWLLPHGWRLCFGGAIESFFLLDVSILLIVLAPFFCRKSSEGSAGLWVSSALICPMSFTVFQMHCELFGWDISSSVLFLVVMIPSLLSIGYLWLKGRMTEMTVSAYAGVSIMCAFIFSMTQYDGWDLVLSLMVEAFVLMWVVRYFGQKAFAWVVVSLSVLSFLYALSADFVPVVDMWDIPGLNVYLWQLGLPLLLMMASYWIMPAFPRVVNLLLVLGGTLLFILINLEIANFFTPEGSPLVYWLANSFAHTLAYSCAWGLFALCLLTLGFIKHNKALRWVGLALFATTLFKVFCFDTVYLRDLYRILSLFITAAFVIGASVFYQKWIFRRKTQDEVEK